jgi:hypothetical protein
MVTPLLDGEGAALSVVEEGCSTVEVGVSMGESVEEGMSVEEAISELDGLG